MVFAVAGLATSPLSAKTVTLKQAADAGLARSPELGQAQARTGQANAAKDEAKRQWMPNLEADGAAGLVHLENDARVKLGLSALNQKPLYATIEIDQPVFDFGRRANDIKTQKANLVQARQDEEATGEAVAYAIAKAYLQVLVQERIVKASGENVSFHEALSADMGEGVAGGKIRISEKQQADERLQTARISLLQSEESLNMARAELAALVGIDDLAPELPDDPAATLPATLDAALASAERDNPHVASMEAKFRAAQWATERARAERWPTVGLRGIARAGSDFQGYAGQTRDYEGLVIARWNFFDGGITAARVRKADNVADEARFALAEAQRESALQVNNAWISLRSWQTRFDEEQARLAVADSLVVTYRAQFQLGWRSLLDLLDAQNSVYNATVQIETARFGRLLAEYGMLAQLNQLRARLGVESRKIDPKMYGPR